MISPVKSSRIEYDIKTYRYHRNGENDAQTNLKIAAGTLAGTLIPIAPIAKKQNVNLFKIKYGVKEMLSASTSAIAGGVGAGMLFDKNTSKKKKLDEGVFQLMNATMPTAITALLFKIKFLQKPLGKAFATLLGLGSGMFLAPKLSNKINDPKDKVPDRKLTIKDSVANIDDAVGVLVLAKVPLAQKLHVDKILPLIYGLCGYRAGSSN